VVLVSVTVASIWILSGRTRFWIPCVTPASALAVGPARFAHALHGHDAEAGPDVLADRRRPAQREARVALQRLRVAPRADHAEGEHPAGHGEHDAVAATATGDGDEQGLARSDAGNAGRGGARRAAAPARVARGVDIGSIVCPVCEDSVKERRAIWMPIGLTVARPRTGVAGVRVSSRRTRVRRMPRFLLALAAAAAAMLAAAPAANALVQIDRGIAGARLGNTQAQVRAALGKPRRVTRGTNDFGRFVVFRYAGGIQVTFQGATRVSGVSTSGLGDRTARGVGVGSTEAQVAAKVPGRALRGRGRRPPLPHGQLPGRQGDDAVS
jgi:hypothetical protein